MKNKKALIGYDWEGTTFQPEGKVHASKDLLAEGIDNSQCILCH